VTTAAPEGGAECYTGAMPADDQSPVGARADPADPDLPPLAMAPCRTLCSWGPTGRRRAGLPLFACSGCGSEWVRSEPWKPADADGVVPDAVLAEAARESGHSP
jgi:hypothetical protein